MSYLFYSLESPRGSKVLFARRQDSKLLRTCEAANFFSLFPVILNRRRSNFYLSYGCNLKCNASLELFGILKEAHLFARSNSVAHATECVSPNPQSENRRFKAIKAIKG